jgi:hypothetical protein
MAVLAAGCHGGGEQRATDAGDEPHDLDGGVPDGGGAPDAVEVPDAGAPDAGPPDYPYSDLDVGCAPVFAQSIVPEYHVTMSPDDWAAMDYEFLHPVMQTGGIADAPWHPVQLHVVEGGAEYDPPNVMIRLNGNTSWLQAILFDENPKMQFIIAFNKIDPDGRFEHLRKVKLDMPRNDWTFLQQRVALAWLRGRAGIPAQCANNGTLYVNGEYYGLYSNVEAQDKSFLKRVYGPDNDDGDLWKGGRVITTNEDTFTWERLSACWHVTDLPGIDTLTDLDVSMHEWASETVIGDVDGYNNGRANFFLYDNPATHRFVWLANDLDTALDPEYLEVDSTPVLAPMPSYEPRWERDWYHYLIALNQAPGVARYVTALSDQLPNLDPAEVDRWIDDWSAQIADAAAADPHRPFDLHDHEEALERMEGYPPARATYLQSWLDCWSAGGADADGDGYDMCHDCDDADAAQTPGAVEVCDAIDNDCDGRVDNLPESCPAPSPATAANVAFWNEVFFHVKTKAR